MPPRLACTARLGCKAAALAAIGVYLAYLFFRESDSYKSHYEAVLSSWTVPYWYGQAYGVVNLDARMSTAMLFTWLMLLLSALFTLAYRSIPRQDSASGPSSRAAAVKAKAVRLLSHQLPPHNFWIRWCDGMSVGDMCLVLFWLALNAWYMGKYMSSAMDRINAAFEVGIAMPDPKWQYVLERLAGVFGHMLLPNLLLLFLPIPHSSFLNILTGIPHERMIRYHRWIGHGTMWVLSLHGWLFYLHWAVHGGFWVNFSDWGTLHGVDYLAGTLAYICRLVLWGTATNWCRRAFFNVFYRCHVACFFGFFFFSYIHYSYCWSYFIPGLLLYAVDLVLRAGQLANVTTVTAASVQPDGEVVSLQLQAGKELSGCPLKAMYMMFPTINRWQWHPFTIASWAPDGTLTLHIKQYGAYTQKLLRSLSTREPLPVRLEGPVGNDCGSKPWQKYHTILMIGGGVGANPLQAMLLAMLANRSSGQEAIGLPARVHLVLACRHKDEFAILHRDILAAACHASGWLTLSLHYTGQASLHKVAGVVEAGPLVEKQASTDSLKGGSETDEEGQLVATHFPSASPYYWNIARRIQPSALNNLHLAAVHMLVFFGCFCAQYLVFAYSAEYNTYWNSNGMKRQAGLSWKLGMLWALAHPIVSLGLPFLLAVFPVHMWRYWKVRRAVRDGDKTADIDLATPYSSQEALNSSQSAMIGDQLVLPGSDIAFDICEGRPDMQALLSDWGKPQGTVGVFVGGPERMKQAAKLAVAQLNSSTGAHYDFHCVSHEL